jgi:hypothetical protein
MKLPQQNGQIIEELKRGTQISVLRRFYEIMERYHLDTLTWIEKSVKAGASPEEIKRWVTEESDDSEYIKKCYGAARYLVESANG